MRSDATTIAEYLASLPEDRKDAVTKLYKTIKKNIPKGFQEDMGYGMMGWVVPHSLYPAGYHCDPKQAVPFMGLASQKNYIALYHMGIYANRKLLDWFEVEWKKATKQKLDMGKSCIRFKKTEDIPYELIGKLAAKMTPKQWLDYYESAMKTRKMK